MLIAAIALEPAAHCPAIHPVTPAAETTSHLRAHCSVATSPVTATGKKTGIVLLHPDAVLNAFLIQPASKIGNVFNQQVSKACAKAVCDHL